MPEARGFFPPNLELRKKNEAAREFNRKKYENMNKFRAEQNYAQLAEEKNEIIDQEKVAIEKSFESLRQNNYEKYFEKLDTLSFGLTGKGYIERIVILEKAIERGCVNWKKLQELFEKTSDNGTKLAIVSALPKLQLENREDKKQVFEFLKNIAVKCEGFKESDKIDLDMTIAWGSSQKTKEDHRLLEESGSGEGCECEGDFFVPKAIRTIAKMGEGWEDELLSIWIRLEEKTSYEKDYMKNEEDDSYGFNIELDPRGNIAKFYDKDYADSNYWDKRLILELLAQKVSKKGINFFLEQIRNDSEITYVYQDEINELLKSDRKQSIEGIIKILQSENLDESSVFRLLTTATDVCGELLVRDAIHTTILKKKLNGDLEAVRNIERASSFITPNGDKIAIRNLQEFYQTKIKFEDYKVNELMNKKEVALLESLIGKDEKVLEMGCGAGRLISELAKSGHDISGYDYTERHVQITKENLEKNKLSAKVFQGDWHNNALKDESFDVVYSLGRNILHDYSILSQAELFKEAVRILKPGGQFIFDIPNRTKGNYHELVEGYAEEMKKRGIQNFRYGSIYDSPDGKNFATRYAYSPEDIEQLAQMVGFEIAEVKKEKLETGKDDENLYFILKKKK